MDWVAFGSIATLLAVVAALAIAIWGDQLKALASRPALTLSISMQPPDCHRITSTRVEIVQVPVIPGATNPAIITTPQQVAEIKYQTYYCRLSVGNDGNAAARNVGVRAVGLTRLDGKTKTYIDDPHFMGMGLTWSHANGSTVVGKIDPKLPKHCDLAHVDEPLSKYLQLNTEVTPSEVAPGVWPTVKPAGTYRLRVGVTADNAKTLYKTLKIVFQGKWYDTEAEMFKKGLVITVEPDV